MFTSSTARCRRADSRIVSDVCQHGDWHDQHIRRRGDGVEVLNGISLDVKKVAFFKEAKDLARASS